jgi:hypothetical protein
MIREDGGWTSIMADSGWGLHVSCMRNRECASLPAAPTDTHGHDPILVGLSAFLMGLQGGSHIVIRYKR